MHAYRRQRDLRKNEGKTSRVNESTKDVIACLAFHSGPSIGLGNLQTGPSMSFHVRGAINLSIVSQSAFFPPEPTFPRAGISFQASSTSSSRASKRLGIRRRLDVSPFLSDNFRYSLAVFIYYQYRWNAGFNFRRIVPKNFRIQLEATKFRKRKNRRVGFLT